METFLRTLAVYLFLMVVFRFSGKRTMAELSTFDFILLLIISEATQNALIGDDHSLVTGMAVILTLVMLDLTLSLLKSRFNLIEKLTEGTPVLLVEQGRLLDDCIRKTRVTRSDILQTARQHYGLERMDQIKYAVLESSGGISIIPMQMDLERLLDSRIEAVLDRRKPSQH